MSNKSNLHQFVPQDRLLRAEQVAELLGVKTPRAYELMRSGVLPTIRIGRAVRISEQALYEWMRIPGDKLAA